MRRMHLALCAAPAALALLVGCGSGGGGGGSNDYDAASYLTVTNITSSTSSSSGSGTGGGTGGTTSGANMIVSAAVEQTNDLGCDNVVSTPGTDPLEGNRFPDSCENFVDGGTLAPDLGTISLQNDPWGAKGSGVPLTVEKVVFTYKDGGGRSWAFADQKIYGQALQVPSEDTASLTDIVLVPLGMKEGVRDYFLGLKTDAGAPAADPLKYLREWNATVDIWARDAKSDNTVHTQGHFAISFYNPMVEGP